jgi:hypothetical protein
MGEKTEEKEKKKKKKRNCAKSLEKEEHFQGLRISLFICHLSLGAIVVVIIW